MIFYFYTLNIWRVILHLLSEIVLLQAANLTCDTAYSMHQILPLNLFQNRGRESIGEMEEGTGNPRPKCQYSASAGRKITRPKYYQGYSITAPQIRPFITKCQQSRVHQILDIDHKFKKGGLILAYL